ncbi:MAG: hypothetical protein JW954_00315 [Dehalococcoidaceae bacterium]|nr:hypothetical protein [Dehalococcoidaceae bacterium]
MNRSYIIARKEFKELLANRSTLLTSLGVALFFAIVYSMSLTAEGSVAGLISVDGTLFFLSIMLGVFMAYSLTGHVFYKEKTDRIIETLLSSPATLRQIWLGKTLAVTLVAYIMALTAMLVLITIASIRSQSFILPGAPVLFHMIIAVPVFIGAFVGLNGLAQMALGMKENRLLGFLIFIPLFAGLYGMGFSLGAVTSITWVYTGLVLLAAVLLISLAAFLVRFLSTERIVTTLG